MSYRPTPDTRFDTIEKYLDWGGHTQTVDPIHREFQIHEGGDELHRERQDRGRQHRRDSLRHVQGLVARDQPVQVAPYLPTTGELDRTHSTILPSGRDSVTENGAVAPFNHLYGKRSSQITDPRAGMRPVVEYTHRRGDFHEVSKYDMDRLFRDAQNAVDRRVMER